MSEIAKLREQFNRVSADLADAKKQYNYKDPTVTDRVIDSAKRVAPTFAKEVAKEATAGMTTNALVAGNPLKMTPQGAVATMLPMVHNYGQGDPFVEGYKSLPAPPNISLEPILPVQLPVGDFVKGFNDIFFQTVMGGKNILRDASSAVGLLQKPATDQYPEDPYDYYRMDSKSTR